MLINVLMAAVVANSVDDVDLFGSIGGRTVIPNYSDLDDVGRDDSEIFVSDVLDVLSENGSNVYTGSWFDVWINNGAKIFGVITSVVRLVVSGATIEQATGGSIFDATWDFFGTVYSVFMFVIGLLSFSIYDVLVSTGVYIPDYALFIIRMSVIIPYMIIMFWLAPYAISVISAFAGAIRMGAFRFIK